MMQLNHSRPPTHDSRVNSLRIGDFFVAKRLGRWVSALWRSPYFCSGLTTPSGCIFHAVMTSVGLLSSRDPRLHLGRGTESKVASIEVCWPSGIVQTVTDVAADQILKIEGP
jgi:ASPIC and UnbV